MSRVTHIERARAGRHPGGADRPARRRRRRPDPRNRSIRARSGAGARAPRRGERRRASRRCGGWSRSYETVVRRYPASGYCDNALWQAANLAPLAFERFERGADRRTAVAAVHAAARRSIPPASCVAAQASSSPASAIGRRLQLHRRPLRRRASTLRRPRLVAAVLAARCRACPSRPRTRRRSRELHAASTVATIRDIKRTALPDGVRVTHRARRRVALSPGTDRESATACSSTSRASRAPARCRTPSLKFDDDVVKGDPAGTAPAEHHARGGGHGAGRDYNVFTLYDPFRLVIDFQRDVGGDQAGRTDRQRPGAGSARPCRHREHVGRAPAARPQSRCPQPGSPCRSLSRPAAAVAATVPSPVAPATNSNGQFSLSRQLGLGISRIVIDAGHGGHDPGALERHRRSRADARRRAAAAEAAREAAGHRSR